MSKLKLLEHAIKCAREQKYQKMCLDTRKQFSVAQVNENPIRTVFYWEKSNIELQGSG